MKIKPYFPKSDKELDGWLGNFTAKLPTVGTELNIKPAELMQVYIRTEARAFVSFVVI